MRILSLNVSRPTTVRYKNEDVSTGIYKTPVEGSRRVRRLNIDGDEQADLKLHGGVDKAVYAFPSEHYRFFEETLEQDAYPPGQFGENLTTEGLLESGVRIGDRYRVGDVLFEVSQPRSPCYKFAIKMEKPEALTLCIKSLKTGFYLRVLEEGMIEAGAAIEIEHSDADAPTVETVHRLYYLDKKNYAALAHAADCVALTQVWRDEFRNRIRKHEQKTG